MDSQVQVGTHYSQHIYLAFFFFLFCFSSCQRSRRGSGRASHEGGFGSAARQSFAYRGCRCSMREIDTGSSTRQSPCLYFTITHLHQHVPPPRPSKLQRNSSYLPTYLPTHLDNNHLRNAHTSQIPPARPAPSFHLFPNHQSSST